jgi:hypothetical protein
MGFCVAMRLERGERFQHDVGGALGIAVRGEQLGPAEARDADRHTGDGCVGDGLRDEDFFGRSLGRGEG